MKIIYVNNPTQDENTIDPQLIDGHLYCWSVKNKKLHGTFKEEIDMLNDRGEVQYLLIHDIVSMEKAFCDQGCQPGYGCKKNYSVDNHAIMLSCYMIKWFHDRITVSN